MSSHKEDRLRNHDQVATYLASQAKLDTLRFITCGSVDDGKSTLIGRMLYEAQLIFTDQVAALRHDSLRTGTQDGDIDFSLLVDGLAAEREQGITIDVAYRFFSTDRRKFIVADTPGHEQYTRNMVTGASTVDVAVILVDAQHGVKTQTRRHSFICSQLGIKSVVLAINKMDLVGYEQGAYETIVSDYRDFSSALDFEEIMPIPLSALKGDNVVENSERMSWYHGPSFLRCLESIETKSNLADAPLRFPIQWVNRPNPSFRGFSGTVRAGKIERGQAVCVQPSGALAHVKDIILGNEDLAVAEYGQAVTISFEEDVDASRGDIVTSKNQPCELSDAFQAKLVWLSQEPGYQGRSYRVKIGTMLSNARITTIRHKLSVNTLEQLSARTMELNDLCEINIAFDKVIPFDSYRDCEPTGSFILIDRITNSTVAAGMIKYALRRSKNIHEQKLEINKQARQALSGHQSKVLWFTGLSGSGKSTIANFLEKRLHAKGIRTYILDGDNIRHGLNQDLGFTSADRVENIRRISEVAKLMVDAGIVVLAAFISPYQTDREAARNLFDKHEFLEIFVDTPLDVAEQRDPKGLYKKARRGEIPNFTGIDSPYEVPSNPDIRLDAGSRSVDELVEELLRVIGFQL